MIQNMKNLFMIEDWECKGNIKEEKMKIKNKIRLKFE